MTDTGTGSWSKVVSPVVKAYNANSRSALMNSASEDVKDTPILQYELEKQSSYDDARDANINGKSRIAKLRGAYGAFRILLPCSTWSRAGQPKHSEKVYDVSHICGVDVKAVCGIATPIRGTLPVPLGSTDLNVPRELKAG